MLEPTKRTFDEFRAGIIFRSTQNRRAYKETTRNINRRKKDRGPLKVSERRLGEPTLEIGSDA